jgi:deazaflavin-dependent oxidoreductase (nitroreductase family)
MADPKRDEFNLIVLNEFRSNEGRVGGPLDGKPILILHTNGVRSGASIARPLMYTRDDDRYVVFASMGGSPKHPDWVHNVLADPHVSVEVGPERFDAIAHVAEPVERDRLWANYVGEWPEFAEYQSRTTRVIPAVVIEVVRDLDQ